MIVIKGHKHLKECAYIGDNSSEEIEENKSSEEGNDTHIPNFMRKLTTGMTVPDMAPAGVYLTHHPNDNNLNHTHFKRSSKTANHHLDYAEDLYKKKLKEKIENEDYVEQKITRNSVVDEKINSIPQLKTSIEESIRQLGSQGKDGALLLRKLKDILLNDIKNPTNDTDENTQRLYEMLEKATANEDTSWYGPRLRHYRSRFKRSEPNTEEDREYLSKELFKHDQQNNAAIEEVLYS